MKVVENLVHGSPEWLEWRRGGVGASDIAAICGVCPYKTALDIYNDKKGLSTNKRNSAMQRGIDYEDEARKVFARSQGDEVSDWQPLNVEHSDNPCYKASLDGYNSHTKYILEIKVPNRRVMDMARYNQLPTHYLYQVQWQLLVTGSPKAYFFCYSPDSLESQTVVVFPDEKIQEILLTEATEFLYQLSISVPPAAKPSKKAANADVAALLKEMLECKEKEKEAAERYKSLLAELMQVEGVEDGIESDSATLSVSERSSYDYKRAAEDAGVNLEAYKKPVTKVWIVRAKAAI